MVTRTPESFEAEIEALKARIRRLRLERKAAALAQAESELLDLAHPPAHSKAAQAAGEEVLDATDS